MSTNKVAAYWNKRGETYDRSWQSIAKKRVSRMETDLVENAIRSVQKNNNKKTVKVLDIGVAIGRICDAILKHSVELYGTDISQTMIDYCKEKYANNKKVKQFKLHDIHNPLPRDWGTFDVVSAFRVLAYTPNVEHELTNIYNNMNTEGVLVFTYPNKYSSAMLPKLIYKKTLGGYEKGQDELENIIKKAGFSDYQIVGYSRLLDTFYDRCNSQLSANILFAVEKFLSVIFGPTLFVRLFYITCKK